MGRDFFIIKTTDEANKEEEKRSKPNTFWFTSFCAKCTKRIFFSKKWLSHISGIEQYYF